MVGFAIFGTCRHTYSLQTIGSEFFFSLLFLILFRLLNDGGSVLAVPLVSLFDFNSAHGELVSRGRASHHFGEEGVHAIVAEGAAHSGEHFLFGSDGNDCGVAESEVHLAFEIHLITGLNPEEDEWLRTLVLGNLHDLLEVVVALDGVAIVDVGKESQDANDLSLALGVVGLLLDKLKDIWLDISLVQQITSVGRNA